MCAAMMFPTTEKGGRGHKSEAQEFFGVSAAGLSMAREILRKNDALAEEVRQGIVSLKTAHQQVRETAKEKPFTGDELQEDGEEPFTSEEIAADGIFRHVQARLAPPLQRIGTATLRKRSSSPSMRHQSWHASSRSWNRNDAREPPDFSDPARAHHQSGSF
jgi:hypothetical protein